MLKITWHEAEVPSGIPVTQVYGLVFDREGRMLLKVETKRGKQVFAPAGGTPEAFDADRVATLRREMLEEVNTLLCEEVLYVGYQLVEGDGERPSYAQVRMTAVIDRIGERRPDPDNGETYDRVLVSPRRAIDLLGWGEIAERQILRAAELARTRLSLGIAEGSGEHWI